MKVWHALEDFINEPQWATTPLRLEFMGLLGDVVEALHDLEEGLNPDVAIRKCLKGEEDGPTAA